MHTQQVNSGEKISCSHPLCRTSHEGTNSYSAYSSKTGGLARFFRQLVRLLQLLGALFKNYDKVIDRHFIIVVDQETAFWKEHFVQATMSKVIAFYKKYKINVKYTIDKRKGIRSVGSKQKLTPMGKNRNIFLVDEFNDCDNCALRGYEKHGYVLARYYEHNGQPSSYLWTTVAHEIGHNLGLKHGGTLKNLMNEMGPAHDTVNQVILTICQVAKMKR